MTITTPSPAGGSVPGGRHAFHAGDSPPGSGARPFPHVPGVTHRFVDVRGARLHVAEAGDGDPVVLLHSFPQHWYAWRHVVPLLAGQYRLIIPDWRGFGWSQAPPRGYDTASRAADILALMDALGLDRVRLVAHDWGAHAAFVTALQAPDRVSHLLAVNAAHPWLPQRKAMRSQIRSRVSAGAPRDATRRSPSSSSRPCRYRGAALLWSPVSAARPAIPLRNIMQSRTTVPGPAVAPLRRRARREYWTRAAR